MTRIKPVPTYPAPDLFTEGDNVLIDFAGHLTAVSRTDFLAAVASELNVRIVPADAIVIERSETVEDERTAKAYVFNSLGFHSISPTVDADLLDRAWAHAGYLAQSVEFLRANPPVDEAQVAAVRRALEAASISGVVTVEEGTAEANLQPDEVMARRLVAQGVRVVTS
jgi:hypothetical protein